MSKFIAAVLAAFVAAAAPPESDRTAHVLNRIAFGPTAADVARLKTMGFERYLDDQLHPDRLDDALSRERLAPFETLTLSSRQMAERYERPLLEARRSKKNGDDEPAPEQRMLRQRANSVIVELSAQKLLRAVYSERQLQEVMADFWFNHFNVDARKGPDRFLVTEYERDVIRPRVFGRFRDLLGATAKSPAMLFYLDNWMSADPNGPHAQRGTRAGRWASGGRPARTAPGNPAPPANQKAPKGLNENYARELMELHTLGVDGGYTQKDVTEVARAFTGWTIDRPREGGEYRFAARLHDPGQKVVLGQVIRAGGGESDGERVLDILAAHPSTARLIATKLARRFVSDNPPQSVIDRAAARFRDTAGDLREVVRTILLSPEFLSADAYNAKAKTPFEFLASALRASQTDIRDPRPWVRTMQELGMPLYQCQPPTGYADTADAWINSGALVARLNVATRIAAGDEQLAMKLGSPEFQRR